MKKSKEEKLTAKRRKMEIKDIFTSIDMMMQFIFLFCEYFNFVVSEIFDFTV